MTMYTVLCTCTCTYNYFPLIKEFHACALTPLQWTPGRVFLPSVLLEKNRPGNEARYLPAPGTLSISISSSSLSSDPTRPNHRHCHYLVAPSISPTYILTLKINGDFALTILQNVHYVQKKINHVEEQLNTHVQVITTCA